MSSAWTYTLQNGLFLEFDPILGVHHPTQFSTMLLWQNNRSGIKSFTMVCQTSIHNTHLYYLYLLVFDSIRLWWFREFAIAFGLLLGVYFSSSSHQPPFISVLALIFKIFCSIVNCPHHATCVLAVTRYFSTLLNEHN